MFSLSIVVPAYNEEANVGKAVQEIATVAERMQLDYEIIVVNDGSTDQTSAVVNRLLPQVGQLRLVEHTPNRGYGGALQAGFSAASKEFIAFFPADKQFDFGEVRFLIERAAQADIVSGYRVNRQDHLIRKLNAWGWQMVIRILFGYLCRDIDCGFKLFRREVLAQVKLTSNGAMLDTELLAGAQARGFLIAEVPLTHLPRLAGEATGANVKVVVKAFRDLLRFWWRLHRELRIEVLAHRQGLISRF